MGYNIKFYCRQSKTGKDNLASVEVSIIVDSERVILSLPRKESPSEFKKAVESKRENDIKNYLNACKKNIDRAITEIAENGEPLTKDTLREYIKNGGVKKYTIEDMFTDFMSLQKKKVNVSMGKQQYRKYEIMRDAFYQTIDKTKPVTSITNSVVNNFYATISKSYKQASAASIMVKLKTVVEYGIDNNKIKVNPFCNVRIDKGKPREEYLTDEELDMIRNAELPFESLRNARNLFLFQCASGISYADLKELKTEDIIEDNGVYSVTKHRCKTDIPFTSVILPEGVKILKEHNFCLNVISNQKYNFYLLQIQNLCGLKKRIHSHLGRKVYGSTLLKNGVGIKTVSRALGHSNTQITQSTYAFLQSQDIIKEISRVL